MRHARPTLTKTELRIIAEELDTSHGRLLGLVQAKPWLTEISQRYLYEKLGRDKFPVFRTVALMQLSLVGEGQEVAPHILQQVEASKELRPERVVSTSLNPEAVLIIASQQADQMYWIGKMFSGNTLRSKPVIVRYEITLDRVLLYVPALIDYIKSIYTPEELAKTRYRNRYGKLRRVPHVFYELERREENEVIADVTDLSPADIFKTEGDLSLISLAREMLNPAFDPIEHMRIRGEWGPRPRPPNPLHIRSSYVPPPPGPTKDQLEKVQWMSELFEYVQEFFTTQ